MARFTDLPPELRNVIYGLVLTDQSTLAIRHRHYFEFGQTSRAFTQVSQQLRGECLPIYYSTNKFLFSSHQDTFAWIRMVGVNAQHLRHLELLDGIMEGLQWPVTLPERDRFRIKLSVRLTSDAPLDCSHLITEDEVIKEMKEYACMLMKPIERVLNSFGSYNVVLNARIPHCGHCLHHGATCYWCTNSCCRKA